MGRIYTATFENVAVAAAQDLFQVKGAAGKVTRIRKQWLSATDTTIPTSQMLAVRGRFLPATVTDGSGGATPTFQKSGDPGDAAASCTVLANNTTKATTSGTASIVEEGGCHAYNGYEKSFMAAPIPVGPSESYVFELLSTPAGTLHLSGGIEVEEIGG